MYEGEVTEMTPEETEAPGGGFQKAILHVVIGLRTVRRTQPGNGEWSMPGYVLENGSAAWTEAPGGGLQKCMLHSVLRCATVCSTCFVHSLPFQCCQYMTWNTFPVNGLLCIAQGRAESVRR